MENTYELLAIHSEIQVVAPYNAIKFGRFLRCNWRGDCSILCKQQLLKSVLNII